MQTANPILSRIDRDAAQASSSGPGFAYEEGRAAVASAQAPAPAAPGSATDPGYYAGVQIPAPAGSRVTFPDVMVKSAILFVIAVVTAFMGWQATEFFPALAGVLVLVSMLATLGLGLANAFKRVVSPPLIVIYAVFNGGAVAPRGSVGQGPFQQVAHRVAKGHAVAHFNGLIHADARLGSAYVHHPSVAYHVVANRDEFRPVVVHFSRFDCHARFGPVGVQLGDLAAQVVTFRIGVHSVLWVATVQGGLCFPTLTRGRTSARCSSCPSKNRRGRGPSLWTCGSRAGGGCTAG